MYVCVCVWGGGGGGGGIDLLESYHLRRHYEKQLLLLQAQGPFSSVPEASLSLPDVKYVLQICQVSEGKKETSTSTKRVFFTVYG